MTAPRSGAGKLSEIAAQGETHGDDGKLHRLPSGERRAAHRGAAVQPDVQDLRRPDRDGGRRRLSAARDGAGHLRAVQERARYLAAEGSLRHLPDRQGVSQRGRRRAISPSARASSSRWSWSSSSSPTRRSRRSPARLRRAGGTGHPGEPQPAWGWELWHKYWVEERLAFYEYIGLPRDDAGGVLADARGTRALRAGHGRSALQVPLRHAGAGGHRRAQRLTISRSTSASPASRRPSSTTSCAQPGRSSTPERQQELRDSLLPGARKATSRRPASPSRATSRRPKTPMASPRATTSRTSSSPPPASIACSSRSSATRTTRRK